MYQSDFTRYARREGDQVLGQIFVIPVCMVLSSLIGLVVTSCAGASLSRRSSTFIIGLIG